MHSLAERLFSSPFAKVVAITDGSGVARVIRSRVDAVDPMLALGADATQAAIATFAQRQRFGALRQAVLVCEDATVVINALYDGTTLVLVADPESNLGLLLSTCCVALTGNDGQQGG
ncbi:MAG: hypothetical protein JNK05_01865 [Myxococcales bacterium]|nr:hypothetical protein [Myxococcales bacterium]